MFGYIDPAAGATIMQLVVAGTVGIGAVVRLKWHTIKGVFDRGGSEESDAASLGSSMESVDEPSLEKPS